jgi:hypothetical protein
MKEFLACTMSKEKIHQREHISKKKKKKKNLPFSPLSISIERLESRIEWENCSKLDLCAHFKVGRQGKKEKREKTQRPAISRSKFLQHRPN